MYIVLEYLSGGTLSQNLKSIQKFPIEWRLELFYQILLPVSILHQKGYAHRDLKPDNIVFRRQISENSCPQPVLIDFALVSNGKSGIQAVEESYTAGYAAPERMLQKLGIPQYDNILEIDPRADDIWGLGAIFYEIIVGEPLLRGNEQKIKTTIIEGSLQDQIDRRISGKILKQMILGMVDMKLANRPSIKELIYAMECHFSTPRVPSF